MFSVADARVAALARRAGLVVIAGGAAGLLTACGSGHPAAAPTVTITTTAPTSTEPASTGPAAPAVPVATTTPAPPAPAGPGTCQPTALKASLGLGQGAAGTFYRVIVLTNVSASPCTLYGYPGVSFVTGHGGSVIGAPASRNPLISDTLITLEPGQAASALTGIADTGALPEAACNPGPASLLQIYPPGDRGALYLTYSAQVCTRPGAKFMTTTAMHAGAASSF
jgi:Protein of unknown function (DUF4232)